MLHVATVLLAFVAVSGARPSLEWGWLSRRKKLSPEEKLEEWRMKDGGRFSGRCSFWGASWGKEFSEIEPDGECTCQNFDDLAIGCLLPRKLHDFSPTEVLELYPDAQLWAANCRCVPKSKSIEEPLPEDADLTRIAAVDFCAALLKNFDNKFVPDLVPGSTYRKFRNFSKPARQAIEGLNSSKCVKSLDDVKKQRLRRVTAACTSGRRL